MTNKKIISVLALFLVLFVAVGAASAADDIAVSDVNDGLDLGAVVVDDSPNPVNDGPSPGTFTDLQNDVNTALTWDNKTLTLERDYIWKTGEITTGVVINGDLTIEGNGHILNGSDKARIFTISGGDITISNLIFTNSKSSTLSSGISLGAIVVGNVDNIIFDNCTFRNNNNYANININKTIVNKIISIKNCIFENNKASKKYAIYSDGLPIVEIYNNTFDNSYLKDYNLKYGIIIDETPNYSFAYFNYRLIKGDWKNCDVINLDHDYNSSIGEQICINRPVTINGNGFTLDAKNLGRIAYISSDNVIIKNVVCINGYSSTSAEYPILNSGTLTIEDSLLEFSHGNKGGVIYNNGSLTVNNCTFKNNTAASGGAIYHEGNSLTINNSNFVNNNCTDLSHGGGAIYLKASCTIIDSNFTENYAKGDGGAIFQYSGNLNTNNVKFIRNIAADEGGAIYLSNAQNTLNNCSFDSNVATYGGAIHILKGTYHIDGCNFTNNSATYGGAIQNGMQTGAQNSTLTVTNCNFVENTMKTDNLKTYSYGGVICTIGVNCTLVIDNCTFEHNCPNIEISATELGYVYGGVIYNDAAKLEVKNSNFVNNSGRWGAIACVLNSKDVKFSNNNFAESNVYDGSLYISNSSVDITNCKFDRNVAKYVGSTGYVSSGADLVIYTSAVSNVNITGCNFTDTKLVSEKPGAGSIHIASHSNTQVNIKDSKFENIYSNNFGAIYLQTSKLNIDNVTFDNCVADNDGGAIYVYSGTLNVTDSTFTNNTAKSGGAIYARSGSLEINNSDFKNNTAINGDGGAICCIENIGDCNVNDCNFTNCNCTGYGGAIYFESTDGTISGCNFINSTASADGGAIYWYSATDANVINCNFTNSIAGFEYEGVGFVGGAIYFGTAATVSGCNFINSTATDVGGAIFTDYDLNVINSNFTGSNAQAGGAIFVNYDATLKAENVRFINNTVCPSEYSYAGAAICSYSNLLLNNCLFDGNKVNWTSNAEGGAIYQGSDCECNITNCNFTNNGPNPNIFTDDKGDNEVGCVYGGAVYIASDYLIDNCIFDNNTGRWGVVLLVNNEGIINNTLINNSYVYQGNLYLENSNAKVYNTNITNSKAELHGSLNGKVYLRSAGSAVMILGTVEALFDNCNIVNNTDKGNDQWNYGGTFYISSGSEVNVIIKDSSFKDNSAIKGGAIWLETGSKGNVTINNTLFDNNKATAGSGGAIYSASCKLNINDCTFENNEAIAINIGTGLGGAIYYATSEPLTINNCNFINCRSGNEGGALDISSNGSTVNVNDCTFTGCNNVIFNKGIITLKDSIIKDSISSSYIIYNTNILNMDNVTVKNNSATNVIWSNGSQITINNSNITDNTINGHGTVYIYDSIFTVTDSTFKKNIVSGNGGALYLYRGSGKITGSDFIDNSAEFGGAIYSSADLEISNSKFINNKAEYGSAIYNEPSVVYGTFINQSDEIVSIRVGGATKYYRNNTYGISEISGITISNCQFSNNDASVSGTIYINNAVEPVNYIFELRVTKTGAPWGSLELGNSYYSEETQICGATVSISDSEFDENIARNGAIVVGNYATFVIDGNKFTNNSAKNGVVIKATGKTNGVQLTLNNDEFIANDYAPVAKLVFANGNVVNAIVESAVDSVVAGNIFEGNANKCIFHNQEGATADFGVSPNIVMDNGEMAKDSLDGYIENDGTINGGTTELIDKHVAVVVKDGVTSYEVDFTGRLATQVDGIVINDNNVNKLSLTCENQTGAYELNDAGIDDETSSKFASYKVEKATFVPDGRGLTPYVDSLSVPDDQGSSEYIVDEGDVIAAGGSLAALKSIIDSLDNGDVLTICGNYSYTKGEDDGLIATGIVINKDIFIRSAGGNSISAGALGTLFVVGDEFAFGLSDLIINAKDNGVAIDMSKNNSNVVVLDGITFDGDNVTVVKLGSTSSFAATDCVVSDGFVQYVDGAVVDGVKVVVSAVDGAKNTTDLTANVTVGNIPVKGLSFNFTATQDGETMTLGAATESDTVGIYSLESTNFGGKLGTFVVSVDLANADVTTDTVTRGLTIWIEKDYNVTRGDVVPVVVILDNNVTGIVTLNVNNLGVSYTFDAQEFTYNETSGNYYHIFNVATAEFEGKMVAMRAYLGDYTDYIWSEPKFIYLNDPVPTIGDVTVSGNYSDKINITFTITDSKAGDVVVLHLLDGSNVTATVATDGQTSITFVDVVLPFYSAGQTTNATYFRNNVACDLGTVTWNIAKLSTDISFEPTTVTGVATGNNTVVITVTDAYGHVVKQGKIKVTVADGVTLDHTDGIYNLTNGVATVKFSYPEAGNYKLEVEYLGGVATNNTDNYYTSIKNLTVVIGQSQVTVTVDESKRDVSGKVNETITITGTVTDEQGNPAKGNVTITVNGETFTAVVGEDGKYSLSFNSTEAGKWTNVPVKFVSANTTVWADGVSDAPDVVKITINKLHTNIVSNYTFIGDEAFNGTYGEQMTLNFTVFDENGNLVKDGQLIFWFNGIAYTTDVVDGYASITSPDFVWTSTGLYNYVVDYVNNGKVYYDSFNFTNVYIPKIATQIAINTTTVNDDNVKDGKITIKFTVTDVNGKVPVSKGVIYYVTPDGIEHSVNVENGVATVTIDVNRTGTYYIAASYYDLEGDFLYSEADFTWDVQLTTTLIKVTKEGQNLIATINVGDELGNAANGKLDLFVNGQLMALNVVNGVASVNLGAYNGPVELNAVYTGADGLRSYDNVILELDAIPENGPACEEVETGLTDVDTTEMDTEDAPEVDNETTPEVDKESAPASGVEEASGIPMQHTAIPVLALILALLVLPLGYRRD